MRTRISLTRVTVLIVAVAALVTGLVALVRPIVAPAAAAGATGFAAYVDVTATPNYPFETPVGPNQQDVILSFVVASKDSPCTPTWGTYYTMDEAASAIELDRRIAQLRLVGGNARVSFGGQANTELAVACTDPAALAAGYGSVVDRYELTSIDLDVEGAAIDDTEAMTRRARAIKQVQDDAVAKGGKLDVWLTLPVSTSGLTDGGKQAVSTMLANGVDLTGVNGMTMDFAPGDVKESMAQAVIAASTSLQGQVRTLYGQAGRELDATSAWARVGITPMIGQNDVPGEVFTIGDAETVNGFARAQGVGLVSMWSANRDGTCQRPLPIVITIVQTSCSGVDQQGVSFADALGTSTDAKGLSTPAPVSSSAVPAAPQPSGAAGPEIVDDPATSPFPIWDPLATYPAGTKAVWKKKVYQAKWWTSGVDPSTPGLAEGDMPWLLVGPVLPGDKPAPLPSLPAGTYPEWSPATAYVAGTRVLLDGVPFQANWWTQGQRPGTAIAGGSPWTLVFPT